uniref:Synaptotagmin-like protein 4 n=1 Tax=Tetraodon nigroviridis TaxID=99883 RepID=H3C358_TETNG
AAEAINLSFLSELEQDLILEVLRRDEELRQVEERRVRKLKLELLDVKRKGAKRGSGKYSQRSCGRCLESMSILSAFSSQCKMCKHDVCQSCRTVFSNGSWLCSVCAKESDLKKRTGDWFYDQRVNRFSTLPGHDLVKVSLKKKVPSKRETAGEVLLRSTEVNPGPPVPLPRNKAKAPTRSIKGSSSENSGSLASRESFELNQENWAKPMRSDTESAENSSVLTALQHPHRHSSPQRSHQASTLLLSHTDVVMSSGPRLTRKKKRHRLFNKEYLSNLDLRHESARAEGSMGTRSRSVPGLDTQDDGQEEDEEEEDIDKLVSFHKRTMASSSTSLNSKQSSLGSLMSIYSETGDFDSVEVSGDVVFTLSYNNSTNGLLVFIKGCHGLAYGDASRHLSNPYVKCYLLPDKTRQSKRKTSIKRNTVDPVYNETLKYSIKRSQLLNRSVLISVWHYGRLSRNTFLGEVEISLDSRDLDSTHLDRMALMPKVSAVPTSVFSQYKGELVISLKFISPKKPALPVAKGKKAKPESGGELHVLIKEAKNLVGMKLRPALDTFVKGYLFPIEEKSTKRKTRVVKKNLNPHYDYIFVYKELSLEQLQEMCLELTVWDKETLVSNEFLGGVRLSSGKGRILIGKEEVEMDSVGEEVSLWEKMMQYPDSWAEGTLPLRATMKKGNFSL